MPKYSLKIDFNVLNHLGLNLYSNVPAVLSELIANAWDADATTVKIRASNHEVIIQDNGCGMDETDVNGKFLTVGYERRKTAIEDLTPNLKRTVMGRKGIGKLSVFSIANEIEIYTKKLETIGFSMTVSEIRESIEKKQPYYPREIAITDSNAIKSETGTKIVLKNLKKRVLSSLDHNLKKRVSRRFDVWGDTFQVSINDELVAIEDRDDLELALLYGDYCFTHTKPERILERQSQQNVSGWIGLVRESGKLQDGNDNLNKISVLTRGKVALEDIFALHKDTGMYTKYIIGEIKADFLDLTGKDDIATSNRQNFIQNDERFIALKEFIGDELKFLKAERNKYKAAEGLKRAEEISAIKEWYATLKGDTKKSAEKLFGKINQIATDKSHRKTLYQHGVLAFEHLRHKEKLQQLEDLKIDSLETAVRLFSELDDIEASLYYQITEGRLEVIKKLVQYIEGDRLEKVVQKHIYEHLWLLDPSWDRATEIPTMEKSIKDALGKLKLTDEEKRSRLDIRYRKTSGKNIIIELKRSSVRFNAGDLTNQVKKYRSAVKKVLKASNENESVEVICLVGTGLYGWEDAQAQQEDERSLAQYNASVITYEKLIKDAEINYQAYLEKSKEKGRIQALLEKISEA